MGENSARKATAQVAREARPKGLRVLDNSGASSASYYRVVNAEHLALVGSPYLEEFNLGRKSFAIASTGYKSSQQRTVLALATYFDFLFDLKTLIISDSLDKGMLKEITRAGTTQMVHVPETMVSVPITSFYHHFDFVDLNKIQLDQMQSVFEHVQGDYDLILWDTPVLSPARASIERFNLMASFFDSLSLIVSPTAYKSNDMKEIRNYFDSYGIDISGMSFRGIRSAE